MAQIGYDGSHFIDILLREIRVVCFGRDFKVVVNDRVHDVKKARIPVVRFSEMNKVLGKRSKIKRVLEIRGTAMFRNIASLFNYYLTRPIRER